MISGKIDDEVEGRRVGNLWHMLDEMARGRDGMMAAEGSCSTDYQGSETARRAWKYRS
jgi:hypothetical protein